MSNSALSNPPLGRLLAETIEPPNGGLRDRAGKARQICLFKDRSVLPSELCRKNESTEARLQHAAASLVKSRPGEVLQRRGQK